MKFKKLLAIGLAFTLMISSLVGTYLPASADTNTYYTLKDRWSFLNENPDLYDIDSENQVTLSTTNGDLWQSPREYTNLLITDVGSTDFIITTKLSYSPTVGPESAGLIVYGSDNAIFSLQRRFHPNYGGNCICGVNIVNGSPDEKAVTDTAVGTDIYLKIEKVGNNFKAYWSTDNTSWAEVWSADNASITGTIKVGLYTGRGVNNSNTAEIPAVFSNFTIDGSIVSFATQTSSADKIFNNLNYVEGSTLNGQALNIQLPSKGSGPFPVVVYIHGGAWVRGDKNDSVNEGAVNAVLNQGYALVSINYRLAQEAKWPAQIYDCKAAIRYLRANAGTYNFDPDKIAVWGASAGAHLAQFMGVTNDNPIYEDLSMGNASFSSNVQAVVSNYGISDLTTWNEPGWISDITTTGKSAVTTLLGDNYTRQKALDASPITHVSKDSVPMFIAHGKNDNVVNYDESTTLANKLIETIGFNKVDTYFPEVAQHADPTFWDTAEPIKVTLNFLQKQFKPTKSLDSDENTRPGYWNVDISGYTNKYLNLTYATTSTQGTQKLHIVLPETGEGPYPLVIFVHGGGFASGNSSGSSVLYTVEGPLQALGKGYAVAIVDYRTAPEAYFPQPIYDVKAAIRYLRANSAKYNLDPYNFAIWGESAGGLIVDFVGTTNNNPIYEDLSMGNPNTSSEVQAVVSWYAITDMTTTRNAQYCQAWLGASQSSNINKTKDASPINHVTSKAPPFYIQHGMADDSVDYMDSVHLYNKLAEQTGEENTKLELFPGIVHAVKIFLSEQNVDQITEWLDTVLVNEKPDLTALNNAATTARTLDMKKYATIGQQEFLAAFTQAKLILDKDYPLKDEVEDAYSALITSTGNLRLFGDVSGEGQITVTDIVKLRGLITGESKATPEQFAAGDINSDGALTVTDIVGIRRIIVGE